MTKLGPIETCIYFMIWTSGISISLFHLYHTGTVFIQEQNTEYFHEDFNEGWSVLGRPKDIADYEWNVWTSMTINLLPWLLLNLVGAETLRYLHLNKWLSLWYTLVTLVYTLIYYNMGVVLLFLLQTLCFYIMTILFQKQLPLWIFGFLVRNVIKGEEWITITEDQKYLVMLSSSWMLLRCLCFCIDLLNSERKVKNHIELFIELAGYSFYLPTMFAGPLLIYCDFSVNINFVFEKWTLNRFLKFVLLLVRCLFWFAFTEFALHYIYVNSIVIRPYIVEKMSVWELAGLGYAMGHFFLLKYVVFYGLPCAWAAAENHETPAPPCCVSRVHLYSYMWRHFDEGLYRFIIKYIYSPLLLCSIHVNKSIASLICFSFIFLWHGGELYVLYWTVLNFIAISAEAGVKNITNIQQVKTLIHKHIKPTDVRRIQCLLAAPLHYFSMVANYFFIGCGTDIGIIFFKQFFFGTLSSNITILFFLYGASQSAVSVELWQKPKKAAVA